MTKSLKSLITVMTMGSRVEPMALIPIIVTRLVFKTGMLLIIFRAPLKEVISSDTKPFELSFSTVLIGLSLRSLEKAGAQTKHDKSAS